MTRIPCGFCKIWLILLMSLSAMSCPAAVITVDVLSDTGAAPARCELRSAIVAANDDIVVDSCLAGSGSDVIEFSVAGTIVLTSSLPDIDNPLEINGPENEELVIDGTGTYRQFNFVAGSGAAAVRRLVLSRGVSADYGGCMRSGSTTLVIEDMVFSKCSSSLQGGALALTGPSPVTIERSLFTTNQSSLGGGALFATIGPVNVTDSTFDGNDSTSGGAILVTLPTINLLRCTLHDNRATGNGGAIEVANSTAAANIISSTISANIADSDASGAGRGGGIFISSGSLVLANAIVSGNLDLSAGDPDPGPDIYLLSPQSVTSNGYNLIGINAGADTEFPAGNPNASQDYVGTTGVPLDAGLLALGSYGGPVPTMPSGDVGPVIDQGSCAGELADQRGFSNPDSGLRINDLLPANADDGCDIGAVELPLLPEHVFADGFEVETP